MVLLSDNGFCVPIFTQNFVTEAFFSFAKFWSRKLKGIHLFQDLSVGSRIILKWILNGVIWILLALDGLQWWGFREHGNDPWTSKKNLSSHGLCSMDLS
jgi:hypothetical protein